MKTLIATILLLAATWCHAGDFYLVFAEWCPGCRVMKNRVPKEVKLLDWDRDPQASKLLRGKTIPQLVYLGDSGDRTDLTGVYQPEAVSRWMNQVKDAR